MRGLEQASSSIQRHLLGHLGDDSARRSTASESSAALIGPRESMVRLSIESFDLATMTVQTHHNNRPDQEPARTLAAVRARQAIRRIVSRHNICWNAGPLGAL